MGDIVRTMTRLGYLLLLLAFCLLTFQNYEAFVGCAVIGAVVGVAALGLIIADRKAIRISWIVSATLLVGYAGGAISTWFNASSFEEFAYAVKYRPFSLLSITLGIVYGCCSIAFLAGRLEPPCFDPDRLPRQADKLETSLIVSGLLLILASYVSGDYGYGGVQVNESTSRISAWGALAELVAAPIAGLCAYIFGRSRSIHQQIMYGAFAVASLISIVPSGRRLIVLALLVALIGFALSGALKRIRMRHAALALATLGGFAYLTTSYFYALRLSLWELGPTAQLSDQMSLAFDFMISPALQGRFSTLLAENIRERTFTIGYLADLVEATYRSGPLYGEALSFYVRIAIPSALDPSKSAILDYQQIENLAHPKLNLPVIDQANSVLTDGVTDFGVPGALIYLLGVIVLLRTALWIVQRVAAPTSCLFAGLVLVHVALKPELTLSDYFVTIRNLSFLFLILALVEQFATARSPVPERDLEQDTANGGGYRSGSWPL